MAMPPRITDDPKRWRNRADEMRALSGMMINPEAIVTTLRLADGYDRLADRAQLRANQKHASRSGAVTRKPE
jgi:hypothetical protein